MRIRWAITRNSDLREQLLRAKFASVVSNSPVDEVLAERLFAQRAEFMVERSRELGLALTRTAQWVETNDALIEWVRPNTGAVCCVRLRPTVFDDAAVMRFSKEMADAGVQVASGAWFGDEARVFRLGFGYLPMETLEAGLGAITGALQRAR